MDTRYLDRLAGVAKAKDEAGHPLCAACGYDLFGNVSNRCPECGHSTSQIESQQVARDTEDALREAEVALHAVPIGWKIGVTAMAVRLTALALQPNPAAVGVIRSFAVIAGFSSLCLALGGLRVGRVPEAARSRLKVQAPFSTAFLGVMIGVILIVTGVVGP